MCFDFYSLSNLLAGIKMSAYGAISRASKNQGPLQSTLWKSSKGYVTAHHLTLATASTLPGLVPYLHTCFAEELERGTTYPQEILPNETYSQAMFESYYFVVDVIVAICGQDDASLSGKDDGEVIPDLDIASVMAGRSWQECIAGCYYVRFPRLSAYS